MGTATTTGMALKDENYQLRAKVSELEEYIKQRGHAETESDLLTEIRELTGMSDHGNGELLLGWMDAHSKACDRADAAEAKLVEVEEKNKRLKKSAHFYKCARDAAIEHYTKKEGE